MDLQKTEELHIDSVQDESQEIITSSFFDEMDEDAATVDEDTDALISNKAKSITTKNQFKVPVVDCTILIKNYKTFHDGDGYYIDFIKDNEITTESRFRPLLEEIADLNDIKRIGILINQVKFIEHFGDFPTKLNDRIKLIIQHIGYDENWAGVPISKGFYELTANERIPVSNTIALNSATAIILDHYDMPVTDSLVGKHIGAYFDARKERTLNMARHDLEFKGNTHDAEWDYIAENYFDLTKSSKTLVINVLKKFIQQVKQKMNDVEVGNHLMPVILGEQGSGKSYWVHKIFCSPVSQFMKESDFASIQDKSALDQWRYYVQFLDECANAQKSDVDLVKKMITAPVISTRILHSHGNGNVKNNTTFIACSNASSLADIIRDDTGNRRFAPIYFRQDKNLTPLPFDPIVLWQSVELKDDLFYTFNEELGEVQVQHQDYGNINTWFEEFEISEGKNLQDEYSVTEIREHFSKWVKDNPGEFGKQAKKYKKLLQNYITKIRFNDWQWISTNNRPVIRRIKNVSSTKDV